MLIRINVFIIISAIVNLLVIGIQITHINILYAQPAAYKRNISQIFWKK